MSPCSCTAMSKQRDLLSPHPVKIPLSLAQTNFEAHATPRLLFSVFPSSFSAISPPSTTTLRRPPIRISMGHPSYPMPPQNAGARDSIEVDAEGESIFAVVAPSIAVAPTPRGPGNRTSSTDKADEDHRPRKVRKVSRACDFCKSRKARCSGDQPCAKCVAKGIPCVYNAQYTRGRPPTPPPSDAHVRVPLSVPTRTLRSPSRPLRRNEPRFGPISVLSRPSVEVGDEMEETRRFPRSHDSTAPSRASPELSMAEIQGQVFDPTSGLTFLHRALKRLSDQNKSALPDVDKPASEDQPLMTAGDKPLPQRGDYNSIRLPDPDEGRNLLSLYFDVCIATYRILHQPTMEGWLTAMERNLQDNQPIWNTIGRARAAIVLVALAIASLHQEKSRGFLSPEDEDAALASSDELYTISARLADEETGFPKLESAQARIVQVLYLLTTSRFNRGWYVFGNALQLIAALGLHRRANSKRNRRSRSDYVHTQCGIRTFWTAYILDNYLGVVFGRPRHFHDEDIDQAFPDRVNDEEMTVGGPGDVPEHPEDCNIDALIFHARSVRVLQCFSIPCGPNIPSRTTFPV